MKNTNYRFRLEGSYSEGTKVLADLSSKQVKHHCISCRKRSFVRYVDIKTNKYLPEQYGKCDHESKCGYYLSPYSDGYAKSVWENDVENEVSYSPSSHVFVEKRRQTFMPEYILRATLKGYSVNTFVENLKMNIAFPFPVHELEKVIELYYLGTVSKGYLSGGTSFPFIDINGSVRGIQVKTFDTRNHTLKTGNIHSILSKYYGNNKPPWLEDYLKNEGFFNCLFGEHLLSKYPTNTIVLVEAPKTAIYGTLYFGFPDDKANPLWLGVYNLSSLTYEKCKVLQGRKVILFPDLSKSGNAYAKWNERARFFYEVMPGTQFIVSDLLEGHASEAERVKGGDLADYLILQDWRLFRNEEFQPQNYSVMSPELGAMITKNPSMETLITKFDLTTTN